MEILDDSMWRRSDLMSECAFSYRYKFDGLHKVSADIAGRVLQELSESENGLTPQGIVDVSRDVNHPLHNEFEWDNTVADCDKHIISPAYCAENGIDISNLPEPYTGNVASNVVCLNLNPGIGKCDACFRFDDHYLRITQNTLCHRLDHHMWIDDEIKCKLGGLHEGCKWWRDKTKDIKVAIDNKNINMFVLEFFPYHSQHSFPFPNLPSDNYRNQLLQDAINKEKLIVIMRGKSKWFGIKEFGIGEKLKELEDKNRIIILSNPQNPSFSSKNIGEEAWNILIEKLK